MRLARRFPHRPVTELDARRPTTARTTRRFPEKHRTKGDTVAKDKGRKKDGEKAEKKGKGGAIAGGFASPSEAPSGGDGWKVEHEDNLGAVLLIMPLREEELETTYGKKPAVFADVVVVNVKKPEDSEAHDNVAFWGGWTRGTLRGPIGKSRVLGVPAQGDPRKKGENAPWILEDANEKQKTAATAYLDSLDPLR